ncbi:hypothetical protein G7085_20575 [Tessaracoccus sp. HDW20]|nr:hypothetical protein [Tessaracoccus coleopterorum]
MFGKKFLAIGTALAASLALTACGGDSPEGADNMNLVLYSSMTENDLGILQDLLTEKFPGIELEVVNGSAGELTTRIASESGKPQGDMMWAASTWPTATSTARSSSTGSPTMRATCRTPTSRPTASTASITSPASRSPSTTTSRRNSASRSTATKTCSTRPSRARS